LPDASASSTDSERKRRAEGLPPTAAALYCSGGPTASSVGGAGYDPISAQQLGLLEFAKDYNLGGLELIAGLSCVGNGAEHQVYFDSDSDLAIKVTRAGTYGHSAYARECRASPEDYVQRLVFHNWLFPNETRIVGIAVTTAQIITSQAWVSRTSASTPPEIDVYLAQRGFTMFPIDERDSGHYSSTLGLVILDAHPGNVIKSGKHLFPIDLVIGYPGPALLERIRLQLR
jgi:hypothetical protein